MTFLPIKGLQKTSLVDYPGKVAATVFVSGCNFRCPFCYNVDLVLHPDKLETIKEQEIIEFLKKRKKWLDGVCISGGEPLLYDGIINLTEKIKKEGFLVKIDTNGTNPGLLKELVDKKLIDYVAMDIKGSKGKYNEAAGVKVDMKKIEDSIEIIKKNKADYEFRMTVVPKLHDEQGIEEIGKWLKGAERFFLQQFRNKKCLNKEYERIKPYTKEELSKFRDILNKYIKKVEVRA